MGPSYRSCPFVCPSICLSFCGLLVTRKQKKCRKTRTGINVPQDTSKWNANFYLKRSKVKVIGCQKPPQLSSIAFIYRWSIEWRLRRRLQTRPRQMAAYHVSTRCLFLFCIWLCWCYEGERCSLQEASRVEVVFKGPKEVQNYGKEVGDRTAEFVRWTGPGRSVYECVFCISWLGLVWGFSTCGLLTIRFCEGSSGDPSAPKGLSIPPSVHLFLPIQGWLRVAKLVRLLLVATRKPFTRKQGLRQPMEHGDEWIVSRGMAYCAVTPHVKVARPAANRKQRGWRWVSDHWWTDHGDKSVCY